MKGVNFAKEIPSTEISENIKILPKLEKNQKMPIVPDVLKRLTISMMLQKHIFL